MFHIDTMSRTPIYEQIRHQLERFILTGILSPGDKIPSVRQVSTSLSVNPITILKAYSELDGKGYIHSVPGKGYFVSDGAVSGLSEERTALLTKIGELAAELAIAGIPIEEVTARVSASYEKAKLQKGTDTNDKG